jgi:uridine phosphorylase
MHYYKQDLSAAGQNLLDAFKASLPADANLLPYFASADKSLLDFLGNNQQQGITITAPGFYSPQGRQVRAVSAVPQLIEVVQQFNFNGQRITNLEMETAGIYGLAAALGHKALSCNVILANRITQTFSKQPAKIMAHYIKEILGKLSA